MPVRCTERRGALGGLAARRDSRLHDASRRRRSAAVAMVRTFLYSLSPVPGGEGRGEGPNGKLRCSSLGPSPYPSPPRTGERGPERARFVLYGDAVIEEETMIRI